MKEQIENKDKELFIVVSREIESSQRWLTEFNEKYSADSTIESIDNLNKKSLENIHNHNLCNNEDSGLIENGNFCDDQSSR